MSQSRSQPGPEGHKEPHSVSLKGRLSRPTFSFQQPLPNEDGPIHPKASMSFPADTADRDFMLSPNLTLLPSFGSAYVGETFSCSLCANNELLPNIKSSTTPETQPDRTVSSIHIFAEMQTPSQVIPLDLLAADTPENEGTDSKADTKHKPNAPSLQRILNFDLKEEGNHVLAVSVSYTETFLGPPASKSSRQSHAQRDPFDDPYNMHSQYPYSPYGNASGLVGQSASMAPAAGGRVRTFRKLYQFTAQPSLSVRTKTTELAPKEVDDPKRSIGRMIRKRKLLRFALEAQVENVGDGSMLLEDISLLPKPPFVCKSLNWDLGETPAEDKRDDATDTFGPNTSGPLLAPRDIYQLAFLIEQDPAQIDDSENADANMEIAHGRTCLGQLSIGWRGRMGERGFLTTGNLMTKRK